MSNTLQTVVRHTELWSVALVLAVAMSWAGAVERGNTAGGVAYLSGGISTNEQVELQQERSRYTLWLTTAARDGDHLADVRLRIADARTGQPVLEHVMVGPWFFAALPEGRYTVEASVVRPGGAAPSTQRLTVNVPSNGPPKQQVLRFDTGDVADVKP